MDNSTYGVNMRRQAISENSSWNAWHLFDNGLRYPTNGWYSMNRAIYHYTDYQYDVDTQVDGYQIGSDGVAYGEDGAPIPVTTAWRMRDMPAPPRWPLTFPAGLQRKGQHL